ncbi:MAG TPA: hypothetical protein VND99_04065 [Candidatus Acidoferrales bacterium]|nr:hypothetical protein [Candidatus Acidoferrales bacterium]
MNIKQFVLSATVLFIAIQITLVTAYAQVVTSSSSLSDASASGAADYQLAYPGLLPDNPFYFLKVIRDNLAAFFISKPIDKASFDLLQADKDVEASYLLVTSEQGKGDLAFKTFSQSQDYFADAISQTANAKKQGYSITDISRKLQIASKKHEQILQAVARETHQENTTVYKSELSRSEELSKMAWAL